MKRASPCLLSAAAAALLAAVSPAVAEDHDFAREAVQRGDILPLGTILERAARDFRGEVLEVELEREHDGPSAGRIVYEVKLLAPGGDVTELYYDARSGELLRAHGHDLEHSGRRADPDEDHGHRADDD